MSCENKLNLEKTYTTDLKFEKVNSNKEFLEDSEQKLSSRNLEIKSNESSPTLLPDLESKKLSKESSSKCEILIENSIDITNQINEKIENAFAKYYNTELFQQFEEIKSKMDKMLKESHAQKLLRELIRELKIHEINNEFREIDLSYENENYFINGKFSIQKFNDDFIRLCEFMKEKYSDTSGKDKYLIKLFNYNLYDLNKQQIHYDLKNYSEEEIKEAIEEEIHDNIDENQNHRLVCFFNKWKDIRKKN
ncbi:unnamed protein product [Brachionus calyciflorus]|uniref:Uncharacterized protein n=1 Tax=Brachionus calyciflorus TaxID=104777 RepID=A0A813M9U6_9BILA|nr:unnamed protein product [Brachionus calyciflorus]